MHSGLRSRATQPPIPDPPFAGESMRCQLSPSSNTFLAAVVILASGCASAPASGRTERPRTADAPAQPAATPAGPSGAGDSAGGPPRPGSGPQPRPYARVITPGARTQRGLFAVHQIGDRLFFEIPARELNRDQLVVVRAAAGTGGNADRVVRWDRSANRVFLRQVNYNVVADTTLPIYRSVAAQSLGPIIAAFNVEAYGPDSAPVIDATKL